MPGQELAQWRTENAVRPGQTVTTKMAEWPPTEKLQVGERLFISAHVWNSATWHIHQRGILPVTLRNREPLLLAVAEKVTAKRIDISIPHLHLSMIMSMIVSNQNMKLWAENMTSTSPRKWRWEYKSWTHVRCARSYSAQLGCSGDHKNG